MQDRLLFIIGSPRSGSTMLARMLGAHSAIHSPAEPHLMTPLAHLGYFARVDAAPYEPLITENAMRELVAALPEGEADFLDAMRALTDTLYERLLRKSGRQLLLDKTPAYALVLDFIAKVYPEAKYIVLTRHPFAVWSSQAESFFDGDHVAAHETSPVLERYVPAIARFIRDSPVPQCRVRYEELVQDPESHLQRICDFAGIAFEPGMINYGETAGGATQTARGLGDPMSVQQEKRPTTKHLARWAGDLEGNTEALNLATSILEGLLDEDLETWGYRRADLEAELAAIPTTGGTRRRRPLTRHSLERRMVVRLRKNIHQNALGKLLKQIRRVCDLLLR